MLRHQGSTPITDPGALIAPVPEDMIPLPRPDGFLEGATPTETPEEADNG